LSPTAPADVLRFWFTELRPADWWRADPALDEAIRERFAATHDAAVAGGLAPWRGTPEGRLAEILVLDQFSRHLGRGTPKAFAADPLALTLAEEAVALGIDSALPAAQAAFLLMPFMHSESPEVHRRAEVLFDRPGLEDNLAAELRHKAVIDRFGRYPHRNAALGRESTAQERAFLEEPGPRY
jgi:uncharacterized protein (DUF924 family)